MKLAWLLLLALIATAAVHRVVAEEDDAESYVEADEDYQEADRAHLVVRKYFKNEAQGVHEGVQGRNLTVYIDLYNAGTSDAKNVKVEDAELIEGFSLVEGSLKSSFAKVDVGETVSHSYVVSADKDGEFHLPAASIVYEAEADGDAQKGKSSRPWIVILSPVQQITKHALAAGRYVSLGFCRTVEDWRNAGILFTVVGVLFGGNAAVKSAGTARKSTQRKKALAELEKAE